MGLLWLCLGLSAAGAAAFGGGRLHLERHATRSHHRSGHVRAAAPAGRSQLRSRLVGVGSCAPSLVVSNADLEAIVDTSDEWISKRTGIRRRHLLGPGESLTGLAVTSVRNALENAGIGAEEVELVIMATSSPDDLFGDAACIAREVGAVNAVAFDLTAACSGFLFGVNTASQFLHNGAYKTAVVIGADALSRWVDWGDRNTCVLFGDGAGAVVMRAAESDAECGVLGFEMHSNGAGRCDLNLEYSGTEKDLASIAQVTTGAYSPIAMNGKEVYKFATSMVPQASPPCADFSAHASVGALAKPVLLHAGAIWPFGAHFAWTLAGQVLTEAMESAEVTADQIDWLLLHQANIRIMETVAKKLGIPMEKVISNLDEYGNTSAGSIPLALDAAVREGKVKPGDLIAVAGFGAGLSWGSAVIRWG